MNALVQQRRSGAGGGEEDAKLVAPRRHARNKAGLLRVHRRSRRAVDAVGRHNARAGADGNDNLALLAVLAAHLEHELALRDAHVAQAVAVDDADEGARGSSLSEEEVDLSARGSANYPALLLRNLLRAPKDLPCVDDLSRGAARRLERRRDETERM